VAHCGTKTVHPNLAKTSSFNVEVASGFTGFKLRAPINGIPAGPEKTPLRQGCLEKEQWLKSGFPVPQM
jgi:hypothetical protein